jgi:hypothetical protein
MPLIYGEGSKAFARLQEEIIKGTSDLSIFAWKTVPGQDDQHNHQYSGILADSPKQFSGCGSLVQSKEPRFHADFSVTNRGIRIPTGLIASPIEKFQGYRYILCLDCSTEDQNHVSLGLYLRKCGADLFVRDQRSLLAIITPKLHYRYRSRTIYVVSKLPERPDLTQNGPTQGIDLIISNRVSAIRISLPPGLRTFNATPVSHYDSQDSVFFSTEITHDGWCSVFLKGKLNLRGERIRVSCFFACFGWNSEPEYLVTTLADLSTCDPISVGRLLSELEREENDFIPWALKELEHFGIPMQSSVVLADGAVKMSHVAKKVSLPNICKNGMYHVDVFLD